MKYQIFRQFVACGHLKEELYGEGTSLPSAFYLAHSAARGPVTFASDGADTFFVKIVED